MLKFLSLFANDIITRYEMMQAIDELFGAKFAEQAEKLKEVLDYKENEEYDYMAKVKSDYFAYMRNGDIGTSTQPTRSYRDIPSIVPKPICSSR